MAAEERWYFTKQQLADTPNRKCGIDPDKELSFRQQAANFIQDMGQRLQVNQLCINTAIVYMHRFYMFHTFNKFHRNAISTCALFLAAKVEEQPRKLEHVIKVAHLCLHREAPPLDTKSEAYLEQAQELVINENIMLQTLGFDVAIDHPHTHVVKCCQLVRGGSTSVHQHHASKDLAQTSYFMATNSLHMTMMCLQYKPTAVACVCIHLACKWGNWEIPKSSEGKKWFFYVDKTVTEELLEELTSEFLAIMDRCPSRLKRKMLSLNSTSGEYPEVQCTDTLTPNKSAFLTLNTTTTGSSKGEKSTLDRHYERELVRASTSSKSVSSHKSTPSSTASSADKNGTPEGGGGTVERRERTKKEHASGGSQATSALNTSSGDSNQQSGSSAVSLSTSPGKSVKINNADGAQLLAPNDGSGHSLKKTRPDGASRMTPKEYHEYRERNKREKAKQSISSADQNRTVAAAKQAGTLPAAKLSTSANSTDGFSSVADAALNTVQGSTRVSSLNMKQSPEQERMSTTNAAKTVPPVTLPSSENVSSHSALSGFPIGLILTPSPPTTKDGDPFLIEEDMAVFTSPSDLLVPVTESEPAPPLAPVEPIKTGSSKGEHKRQRKEEQKLLMKSPSRNTTNSHGEFAKPQFNSTLSTSELRKRDKSDPKTDAVLDARACGVDSDQVVSRKHHSVKNSSEKLTKLHRVKKAQNTPVKNEIQSVIDGSLPQPDFNMLASDNVNQNLRFSSAKLPELNSETVRMTNDSFLHHSSLPDIIQPPAPTLTNATSSPELQNEVKMNPNFQEKRHSNHVRSGAQAVSQQIPMMTNEKHVVETETALPQPVKLESEPKHSKRSLQSSSSKHEKKEKRKKHDKRDKSREHDKEKSEEKLVPKFKLTIPKDPNVGPVKTEVAVNASEVLNHKPKDESLVVKIKLNTSAAGSKSSKNGNLPEVVLSTPSTETLAIKERSGLKLKLTKNPSSKESYSIGNDEVKSKEKKANKESRKRSKPFTSPKSKDSFHETVQQDTFTSPPPLKTAKISAPVKSPKKTSAGVNNNQTVAPLLNPVCVPTIPNVEQTVKVPTARQIKNEPAIQQQQQQSQQPQQMLPVPMVNNNSEYNRRLPVHEREQRSRVSKRGRGNMRMPAMPAIPPPPLPMAHPQQQAMMYNMPMGMYDRGAGANDGFNQFYNYGQNNFFNHQMGIGFQDENPMFFNQCPPHLRPPLTHPMAYQPPVHQQARRSGHHFIRQPVLPPRSSSGPPLPPVPPPANPPLPPDM